MAKVVKKAPTDFDLHPLINNRWSPRAFDISDEISKNDLHAILEAARLAPSAFNEQPWRFIFGKRGEETFNQILNGLGEFNQTWARNSSALLLVAGTKQRSNGDPHPSYQYDLGLAVSQGTFEAHHRGYVTHQMTGFNHDVMCQTFDLTTFEPVVVIAIGRQADSDILPAQMAEREKAQPNRKPLTDLIIKGSL
ncbi:MAG: oxidoreductase [Candidatus Nanopelagicaceae bacterium]|nr:oxidoreductase [Candidatus Nanopelagicaceae bacterium]